MCARAWLQLSAANRTEMMVGVSDQVCSPPPFCFQHVSLWQTCAWLESCCLQLLLKQVFSSAGWCLTWCSDMWQTCSQVYVLYMCLGVRDCEDTTLQVWKWEQQRPHWWHGAFSCTSPLGSEDVNAEHLPPVHLHLRDRQNAEALLYSGSGSRVQKDLMLNVENYTTSFKIISFILQTPPVQDIFCWGNNREFF